MPDTLENKVNPLDWRVAIVNKDGTPTPEFQRKWAQQARSNGSIPDLTTAEGVSSVLDVIASIAGDILIRGSSGEWIGLPAGTTSQILSIVAGLPAWVDKQFRAVGGTPGRKPLATEELFNAPMKTGDKLAATLPGALLVCEIAPTADWTMTLKRGGTTIGTGTILAGQTAGSYTFASTVNFTDGDIFKAIAPTQDATLSGVGYAILGTRTV